MTAMLPELELESWESSKKTLHLYLQIVGKVQLALMPRRNHWWNVSFLVNSKGLITHVIPAGGFNFEIQFNFLMHQLEITTSNGRYGMFPLENGLSVADFYQNLFSIFFALNIEAKIVARPYSIPDENPLQTPFILLEEFNTYDAKYVQRFWKLLTWVDEVFNKFGGQFYGKTSPVQLFWHHMDLALTRFSGPRAPRTSIIAKQSTKDACSHELISFGFWPGDDNVRSPAFYSYSCPLLTEVCSEVLMPAAAKWNDLSGSLTALLMYSDLLVEKTPAEALLAFLESSYRASAKLLNWAISDLKVTSLSDL